MTRAVLTVLGLRPFGTRDRGDISQLTTGDEMKLQYGRLETSGYPIKRWLAVTAVTANIGSIGRQIGVSADITTIWSKIRIAANIGSIGCQIGVTSYITTIWSKMWFAANVGAIGCKVAPAPTNVSTVRA